MENEKLQKPHLILNRALQRKQKAHGAYSQRALARDLGVSAAFVTKILTGQKSVPTDRVKKIARLLDMDINEQNSLLRSLVFNSLTSPELRLFVQNNQFSVQSKMSRYKSVDRTRFNILSQWYNIVILDLITCANFDPNPKVIAKRVGISERQVQESLTGLEQLQLIEKSNGVYKKTSRDTFFPTSKSQSEVRDFHKQMIKKAFEELNSNNPEDFERRLITGFTIAANPEKLEALKTHIFEFLSDASNTLSEGECQDVYQINVQLFPLTKRAGK